MGYFFQVFLVAHQSRMATTKGASMRVLQAVLPQGSQRNCEHALGDFVGHESDSRPSVDGVFRGLQQRFLVEDPMNVVENEAELVGRSPVGERALIIVLTAAVRHGVHDSEQCYAEHAHVFDSLQELGDGGLAMIGAGAVLLEITEFDADGDDVEQPAQVVPNDELVHDVLACRTLVLGSLVRLPYGSLNLCRDLNSGVKHDLSLLGCITRESLR